MRTSFELELVSSVPFGVLVAVSGNDLNHFPHIWQARPLHAATGQVFRHEIESRTWRPSFSIFHTTTSVPFFLHKTTNAVERKVRTTTPVWENDGISPLQRLAFFAPPPSVERLNFYRLVNTLYRQPCFSSITLPLHFSGVAPDFNLSADSFVVRAAKEIAKKVWHMSVMWRGLVFATFTGRSYHLTHRHLLSSQWLFCLWIKNHGWNVDSF